MAEQQQEQAEQTPAEEQPQEEVTEQQPVTTEVVEEQPAEAEQQPSIPVDKQGNPLYEQSTPELAVQDIYNNQGLPSQIADQFVANKLAEAKTHAEKLAKKEPQIGTNIAQYKEAMAQWQQAVTQAEANVAFWQQVQSIANEATAEVAEETATEEQTPTAETEQTEQPQAETTEEQPEEVAEEQPEEQPTTEETAPQVTEEISTDSPTLIDVVRTIYERGKEFASKLFQRSFFDVAKTPDFMKPLGLRGDKFTIKYGVIARHLGKDSSHTLTERDWEQLPQALQAPFAITKLNNKKDSYRIYTTLQNENGEYIAVGVDVKNAGRKLEVNAISTAFGRRNDANLPTNEEVIYKDKNITPEQSSLLERPNFAQYPTEQELSKDKDTQSSSDTQASSAENNEAASTEKKADIRNGKTEFQQTADEIVADTPDAQLATEATVMALTNSGIEVVQATDEMAMAVMENIPDGFELMAVEEAKRRADAIEKLAPINIVGNTKSEIELKEEYKNLPSVEKDGKLIAFYNSAFKKIYKEGGLFAQVVPQLDEILNQSILAYSEADNLGGTIRPDGTIHKVHDNVESFDNYVGKVTIGENEYYVRITVQRNKSGDGGTHAFFVSNVELYKNPAKSRTIPLTLRGTTNSDEIIDTKLQQFFDYANGKLKNPEFL